MTSRTYKQLSHEERQQIQSFLDNTKKPLLCVIAEKLGRDPKCIRYEVTNHRQLRVRSNQRNKCGLQNECQTVRLCSDCITGVCKHCRRDNCNQICSKFTREPLCSRTDRWPYVCNGCKDLNKCSLPKFIYYADVADREHIHAVSDWKTGPKIPEKDMAVITKAIQDGVEKKQALDVIIEKNNLPVSLSTAYRYIANREIPGVKNIDLKRKVRYKQRDNAKVVIHPKNTDILEGRRLEDFLERIAEEPSVNVWQMDTVMGKKGGDEKCVLSLLYTKTNLQLYFIMDRCDSLQVNQIFERIKAKLGSDLFKQTFTVILTDNGHEFSEPLQIETDPDTGEKLINIYYCNPGRSDQKGKCEKNHEHFRELVPKGVSMNPLSQRRINYVSNMVNNYPRKSLGYKSPYELSVVLLNEKVLSLNNLSHHSQVDLTPIIR